MNLPIRNLTRKPGRTFALAALTAFLALSMFGGSLVSLSLRNGLDSLEARLGADIILVPSETQSKTSFKNMMLQGTIGEYYMSADNLTRAREVEGVEVAAPQIFLASLKADCCSTRIQVIGIDPAVDFTVQPWIEQSYQRNMELMDVVVGCEVETKVGESLRIYDRSCHVVARLATTGTGLDTAVYCSLETIHVLLEAAEEKGISHKISSESDQDVVSAIYIRVKDGYDVGKVNSALQGHTRKASAVRMKSMLTDVSDSLSGVSRTVTLLVGTIWVLALILLMIAFALSANERKREFAVLRLLGTSRKMLSGIIRRESALCGLLGGLVGTALAALICFPFAGLIEQSLGLPYLMPDGGTILLLALGSVIIPALVAALASSWTAGRLSRVDPGTVLREGN